MFYTTFEAPKDSKSGEYVRLTCAIPFKHRFDVESLPISLDDLRSMIRSSPSLAHQYYDRYFLIRPRQLVSGGSKVLVKLRETRFVDGTDFVLNNNRYIESTITNAETDDLFFSEIVLTWETSKITIVTSFRSARYAKHLKLLATFLLSAERLFSMYHRVSP